MAQAMTLISSQTLGAATATVTFSSIPSGYRDLRLIVISAGSTANGYTIQFNGDAVSGNYQNVRLFGNGASGTSTLDTLIGYEVIGVNSQAAVDIMDYSATDKHKTQVARWGSIGDTTNVTITRWANTAAVTSLALVRITGNHNIGSTFYLYGVQG